MMEKSRTFIAIPPGVTIKEQLNDRGITQKEFAYRMGFSEKHVSKLINGEVQLTIEVARKLEMVLGLSTQFWCNLESIFRENLVKVREENTLEEDIEILKHIPYNQMVNFGWVKATKDKTEKIINLRKFFEVAQLKYLNNKLFPQTVYRELSNNKNQYARYAWTQQARLEARNITTECIDLERLKQKIPEIREMSTKNPEEFCPKLINELAECGIALVFLNHLAGSYIHGASFYENNKIVLGITVRGKDADKFWFSLFHEFGHILSGHLDERDEVIGTKEIVADEFAKNSLIPNDKYIDFVNKNDFSTPSIIKFSNNIKIDKGIVVGRLQKDGFINYCMHNDLKSKYVIE